MSLNVLSLFAGIGGLELGLERAGMTVVGQVEIDDYCRRVLAKHWPNVPRHDDVRTATEWWLSTERPTVDVICGGFPCQDISIAGRRAGIIDGERSSLWTYLAHTVRVLRPRYMLVENVPTVLVRGDDGVVPLDLIAGDLAEIGYDLRWDCVPAASLGAPHRRDRWFGIAYPQREQLRLEPVGELGAGSAPVAVVDGAERHLADATGDGRRQGRARGPAGDGAHWSAVWPQALAHTEGQRRSALRTYSTGETWADDIAGHAGQRRGADTWAVEPGVGRVADGVPSRVDRLRALGNAVVPQVAEHVGRLIVEHASGEAVA